MNQKHIDKINECIRDLVYEKVQLRKAYNYYHGKRDAEQFRHIEQNYGIGTPTSIGFTPLVKKHIDVLVGEYLELDPELKISCKDDKTISNIMRDKKIKADLEMFNYLKQYVHNNIIDIIIGGKEERSDPFIEKQLFEIQNSIDKSYISEYEIAAQTLLTYFKQSRDFDLKNKMRELFTDLLITGLCYYRTRPNGTGENLEVEILNPLNTFIERNVENFYLNKSPRAVVRKWLSKDQILQKYKKWLSKDAISRLDDQSNKGERNYNTVYVRGSTSSGEHGPENGATRSMPSPGILGGLEVSPVFPWNNAGLYNYMNKPVICVMEVEWLEYNKSTKQMDRFEGVKIGDDIYISKGLSEHVVRSIKDPSDCGLSINGMFFLDKNGSPFSLMLSTADLQDKYDLLTFYRDNLISTSGTVGDWIDLAHIPASLGVEYPERLAKWLAYKKNGMALFDSSQDGGQMLNTTFQGYDDTVKAQAIQAIQIAIESIEMQSSAITGVFPEKLGGVQQRDAVSNVKVGLKYSTLITKQYFHAMDMMYKEMNYDLLNLSKIVYSKGISGSIILGKLNKIFKIHPEHYTVTDFDIHLQDSTETLQDRETIKSLSLEMVKANYADPEMIVKMITTKSMTELKQYIEDSMADKKAENNQVQQLSQQIQEYEQAIKQAQSESQELNKQLEQLRKELENNSKQKLQLQLRELELQELKINNDRYYDDRVIETKERQLDAEVAQIYDSVKTNDKVKNII